MTIGNKQDFWDIEQPIFHAIGSSGVRRYVESLSGIGRAFVLADRRIRCIDEGTPGGIHLAGSGILMSPDAFREFCERAKPDGAHSHAECGACGLHAKERGVHEDDPDRCGTEWVSRVATDHGIPNKGTIAINDMRRPSGFHIARVAYYDGTGSFDWSHVPGLPKGFIISHAYLDSDYAKKEAGIACSIALGGHGFGECFTRDDPFYLIAIAKNAEMLASLHVELEDVAATFEGRVKVDGFLSMV